MIVAIYYLDNPLLQIRALEYRVGRYLAPSIECFALAFQFHISVLIIKLFCYVM